MCIRDSLEDMLANRDAYQATHTGEALAGYELMGEYADHWAANPDPNTRVDLVLAAAGQMYAIVPPPSPLVRADDPVAQWLRDRLLELHDQDAELLATSLQARIDTAPVHLAALQEARSELPE